MNFLEKDLEEILWDAHFMDNGYEIINNPFKI